MTRDAGHVLASPNMAHTHTLLICSCLEMCERPLRFSPDCAKLRWGWVFQRNRTVSRVCADSLAYRPDRVEKQTVRTGKLAYVIALAGGGAKDVTSRCRFLTN